MSIPCPVCTSRDNDIVELYNKYTLRHCSNCDVVYAHPMKTDESFYMTDIDYLLRVRLIVDTLLWDFRWDIHEFLENPPAKGGNLLDIGCGTGFFVKRAYDMGFHGYGIDFNERSIAMGREYFKLDTLYALDLKGFQEKFPAIQFHVVTLFQVLEHLEDPNYLMSEVKKVITDDAVVVIALPLRERWPDTSGASGDYPPHHLTRWSLKAIECFLNKNGFFIKRHKVENFPLQNMSSLMYAYILKFAQFLTMKGKGVAKHLNDMTEEQIKDMLKKRKTKMTFTNAVCSPFWLFLKLLGAKGPNLYVEASLKL